MHSPSTITGHPPSMAVQRSMPAASASPSAWLVSRSCPTAPLAEVGRLFEAAHTAFVVAEWTVWKRPPSMRSSTIRWPPASVTAIETAAPACCAVAIAAAIIVLAPAWVRRLLLAMFMECSPHASAVDLKFLQHWRQARLGTSNRRQHWKHKLPVPLGFRSSCLGLPRCIASYGSGAPGGRINNGDRGVIKAQTAAGVAREAAQKCARSGPTSATSARQHVGDRANQTTVAHCETYRLCDADRNSNCLANKKLTVKYFLLNDHHHRSGRRAHHSFDIGDVEAENDGALRWERDFEQKFAGIRTPHHLDLAELPGAALATVHLQAQWLARRFLIREARDVSHLVRTAGIVDPIRQRDGLGIIESAAEVKRNPMLLGNGRVCPHPGEQRCPDPISFRPH